MLSGLFPPRINIPGVGVEFHATLESETMQTVRAHLTQHGENSSSSVLATFTKSSFT